MTRHQPHSICLYRRSIGRSWWRVDAHVTEAGAVLIVSGDANEWTARIAPHHGDDLLRALRRSGDIVPSIGASAAVEILHRLRDLFYRPPDAPKGAFEDIKTFLDAHAIPWESSFWASDADDDEEPSPQPGAPAAGDLIPALEELRKLLLRPGNDFTWSTWPDVDAAGSEVDRLIAAAGAGQVEETGIRLVLAPTGPAQEVALASGWSVEFLMLADRIERALAAGNAQALHAIRPTIRKT